MPRPGPPRIPVALRLHPHQIDAIRDYGQALIVDGNVEPDEFLNDMEEVNMSAVIRRILAKEIPRFRL